MGAILRTVRRGARFEYNYMERRNVIVGFTKRDSLMVINLSDVRSVGTEKSEYNYERTQLALGLGGAFVFVVIVMILLVKDFSIWKGAAK